MVSEKERTIPRIWAWFIEFISFIDDRYTSNISVIFQSMGGGLYLNEDTTQNNLENSHNDSSKISVNIDQINLKKKSS